VRYKITLKTITFCALDSAGVSRWHCAQYEFTYLLTYLHLRNGSRCGYIKASRLFDCKNKSRGSFQIDNFQVCDNKLGLRYQNTILFDQISKFCGPPNTRNNVMERQTNERTRPVMWLIMRAAGCFDTVDCRAGPGNSCTPGCSLANNSGDKGRGGTNFFNYNFYFMTRRVILNSTS